MTAQGITADIYAVHAAASLSGGCQGMLGRVTEQTVDLVTIYAVGLLD